jgi:putative peptidoglycan lipid II flippase
MTLAQTIQLRRLLHGSLEGKATLRALGRIACGSVLLGGAAYATWWGLDDLFGRSLVAQIVSVAAAAVVGFAVYAGAVLLMRIEEARQIERFVLGRLRRRTA